MAALTFDDLRAPMPVVSHSIPVPEFGNGSTAWIAELTARERETRIEEPWKARKDATGDESALRAFLVAACLCTDGSRTFMVPETGVAVLADSLNLLPLKAFDRLYNACESVNGLDAKEQKALEKN